MPPRPRASTTLRAGSYGAVTHSLPPRSGGMHLFTDGGGPSSAVEPFAPPRDPIPSAHPRHDFTWKPSQDIIFRTPSTPTSRPTKSIPRQAPAPSYMSLPTSSAIPIASAAKVGRVDSSGRPLRKSALRKFFEGATQQHQVTDEPRPTLGPDHKPDASAALSKDAQVEKQPLHGQIWWEPICIDTTGAPPVMSKILYNTRPTKGKQSVLPSTKRLKVVRKVFSRMSKQVVAISHGEHWERDQTWSQVKLRRTAAHRNNSDSRAREQQKATEAARLVRPKNACETLGNEDRTIEEHCRLQIKSSGRRASAELSRAVTQLSVHHQKKFDESRHSPASDISLRKKRYGTFEPDRQVMRGLLSQRYLSPTKALRARTLRRKILNDTNQWTTVQQHSDRTESAAQGEQWSTRYIAFRAPFRRVGAGYCELLDTLWDAREDCPKLKSLWTYLTIEVIKMRDEFLTEAHRYRTVARVANKVAASYHSEGLRRTYRSLRRIVRMFYLENPFNEQNDYAVRNLQDLFNINNSRRQLGLGIIHGGGRLRDDNQAIYDAGREFVACVKERDALGRDDMEKEFDRTFGRIGKVIDGLRETMRASRLLLYCWDRLTACAAPPFPLRRNFYRSMRILQGTRSRLVDAANQVELAHEERISRQQAKSAVKRTSITSEEAEAPITSENLFQPHQQILNIHATAALGNAHFGNIGPVQSNPESLFDLIERPNAVISDGKQPLIQCSFQIPEELRKKTLAASSSEDIYWQYNLYQGPAGERVKVHYCRNKESSDRIAKLFLDKSVIGFDIEWKPQASAAEGTKKNVSLVQLASEERIALFHIARFGKDGSIDDLVPPNLKKVMETADITKVGVAVKADCTRLRKFMGIESRGLLELSHLYKLIKFSSCDVKKINKSLVSLAQQVEDHLLLPMWKGEVRSSDWSEELNFQQIQYAASDSYAGLQLYHAMEAKRKAIQPTPPCPAHAELNLPIRLANGQTVATYNEPEEAEDETPITDPIPNNDVLPEVEQMARDFLNITIEDVRQNKVTSSAKSTLKRSPKPTPQKSPQITAAEVWVAAWRTSLPVTYKAKAMPASLRAYAIWHAQGFSVQETASLLRDPPLQVTTVSNYILEAIRMEKLAYDAGRLKEVLAHLPESVAKSRYQSLRRQLE